MDFLASSGGGRGRAERAVRGGVGGDKIPNIHPVKMPVNKGHRAVDNFAPN